MYRGGGGGALPWPERERKNILNGEIPGTDVLSCLHIMTRVGPDLVFLAGCRMFGAC